MGKLFDLEASGYFYSRLQNPTNDFVAEKICAMEGGIAAMLTSSGQAANFYAIFNICEAGDHFITSSSIYGGTYNLFNVTMRKMGIECTFVDQNLPEEELAKYFQPNTKAVFGETITNPTVTVFDFEKFARLAHNHGVPLIVDNTFATPINCRPFEWGAFRKRLMSILSTVIISTRRTLPLSQRRQRQSQIGRASCRERV